MGLPHYVDVVEIVNLDEIGLVKGGRAEEGCGKQVAEVGAPTRHIAVYAPVVGGLEGRAGHGEVGACGAARGEDLAVGIELHAIAAVVAATAVEGGLQCGECGIHAEEVGVLDAAAEDGLRRIGAHGNVRALGGGAHHGPLGGIQGHFPAKMVPVVVRQGEHVVHSVVAASAHVGACGQGGGVRAEVRQHDVRAVGLSVAIAEGLAHPRWCRDADVVPPMEGLVIGSASCGKIRRSGAAHHVQLVVGVHH